MILRIVQGDYRRSFGQPITFVDTDSERWAYHCANFMREERRLI